MSNRQEKREAPRPTGYTVIVAVAAPQLVAQVEQHLADGWVPLGGVATSFDGHDRILCQALVKF
jgi:hypothetical protein